MKYLGTALPSDVNGMLNHPWRLVDQQSAFSQCSFNPSTKSISNACGSFLQGRPVTGANIESGINIQGTDITEILLNQLLDYFQKGLYTFFAQYLLVCRGLPTWAKITNYYASYFSIHTLLCLQGRVITRIPIAGKIERCHILPLDLTRHEFILCNKGLKKIKGGEHRIAFKRYYDIYNGYSHLCSEFDIVYKSAHIPDPFDESDQRNEINYAPFNGFGEIIDWVEACDFITMYMKAATAGLTNGTMTSYLQTLSGLATDPDFKYFARVALRLLFAGDIIRSIASQNQRFSQEWSYRLPIWRDFGLRAFSAPPANLLESLPQFLT